MAIAVLLLAMTSHSRENLPDTASWQDIFSEYDANGYPDWTGESPEGAVGFFGVALEVSGEEAAGTIAPDIVPVPWCLDVNGCIDPDASWEEQRMQNEEQWRDFCDCSVPDAYGHTGHGDNARTYIAYGDYITVYRPDGTLGDVSELYDSLPDCPDSWAVSIGMVQAAATLIGAIGAAAVWGGSRGWRRVALVVVAGGKVLIFIGSALVIGGAALYAYCYLAEGV